MVVCIIRSVQISAWYRYPLTIKSEISVSHRSIRTGLVWVLTNRWKVLFHLCVCTQLSGPLLTTVETHREIKERKIGIFWPSLYLLNFNESAWICLTSAAHHITRRRTSALPLMSSACSASNLTIAFLITHVPTQCQNNKINRARSGKLY